MNPDTGKIGVRPEAERRMITEGEWPSYENRFVRSNTGEQDEAKLEGYLV
jgi:hypothetical protein